MALYIIYVFYDLFLKWNSSLLLISQSQIYILNHFVWQTPKKKKTTLNSF